MRTINGVYVLEVPLRVLIRPTPDLNRFAPASIDGPTLAETMKMLKPEIPIAILSADVQASLEDHACLPLAA
jgi:hypothetical protein